MPKYNLPNKSTKKKPKSFKILEISIKSGTYSTTSTLSLVIHKVRFKKHPAKKYISIHWRWVLKLRKPSILMVPEFHPVFLFS
jgi:hypothetical protein